MRRSESMMRFHPGRCIWCVAWCVLCVVCGRYVVPYAESSVLVSCVVNGMCCVVCMWCVVCKWLHMLSGQSWYGTICYIVLVWLSLGMAPYTISSDSDMLYRQSRQHHAPFHPFSPCPSTLCVCLHTHLITLTRRRSRAQRVRGTSGWTAHHSGMGSGQ